MLLTFVCRGSNARGKHKRANRSSRYVESSDHNDRDAEFGTNEQVGSEEVVDIQILLMRMIGVCIVRRKS